MRKSFYFPIFFIFITALSCGNPHLTDDDDGVFGVNVPIATPTTIANNISQLLQG